jgi:plasmid stability protein
MADVLIDGLDETVVANLRLKAKLHGRSLEEQVRTMLVAGAERPWTTEEKLAFAEHMRKRTLKPLTTDAAETIREMRDNECR